MSAPAFTGQSAATSVLMSATTRSRPVVFVEGACEARLFSHHYPEYREQIVACGGHAGVKEALTVIEKWERTRNVTLHVLGFIDRDYGSHTSYPRITVTTNRDIEIDLYMTPAAERLLAEKASTSKCPDPRVAISGAMGEMRVFGLIRKFNCDSSCLWSLNHIDLQRCVTSDGSLDADRLISVVLQTNGVDKATAKLLRAYIKSNPQIRTESIIRGHDVSVLIGKWLRRRIGNRNQDETNWTCIEEDLRLATRLAELNTFTWAKDIDAHLHGVKVPDRSRALSGRA